MKISFRNRILLTIFAACLVCTISAIFVARARIIDNGEQALLEKSEAILTRLEAARTYVADMGSLEGMIEETVKKYPDGRIPPEHKEAILKSVPIYASLKLGAYNSDKDHYTFRVFANDPRNKDNTPTAWEQKILNKFKTDRNLEEIKTHTEDDSSLFVARPVRISRKQGCLNCHGDPATSPWNNGKDILGYHMENWEDGHMHGAFAVVSSLAPVRAKSKEATMNVMMWGAIFTLIALFIGFVIVRGPIGNLDKISREMKSAGDQVGTASNQLSDVSQGLSSSASEAAASLEETVSSIEELSSMVNSNTENAKEAASLSQASRTSAEKGEHEIRELNVAMGEISASSKQVEEIINVIDDIAFQTNLLALNAAVEAARAGEQGKGFAVVAEAVRNLAQRSADAAKEITVLIKDSVTKVERGSEIASSCGNVLNEIVNSVKKVSDLNNEIATASQEQASGLGQVNQAMNQLDKVTQQNAASAEESAASSEEMAAQAEAVQEMALHLVRTIAGESTSNNFGQQMPNNVIAFRPKKTEQNGHSNGHHNVPPSKTHAKNAIPFDDDDADYRKVGGTNGF